MIWQEITPEAIHYLSKTCDDVLVGVDVACVWIVRSAFWDDGADWRAQEFACQDDAAGWWSYTNSSTQVKLEGLFEPTHWMPMPDPPQK